MASLIFTKFSTFPIIQDTDTNPHMERSKYAVNAWLMKSPKVAE
jgi:hypothetical protein